MSEQMCGIRIPGYSWGYVDIMFSAGLQGAWVAFVIRGAIKHPVVPFLFGPSICVY